MGARDFQPQLAIDLAMPMHRDTRLLPYSQSQLFELVADVARYPEFLPWVIGARVQSRSDTAMLADLVVGFKMFRERFTSKVVLEQPGSIGVVYVSGPLKHLTNSWRFTPEAGGTRIDFEVDFEFRSRLFETMVGALFSEAVKRMIHAFEKRAHELYASDKADLSSSSATRTA
jgi:coenzyme Q-binding protein COQ10